jgi:Arc/MetJ family transcription regulator
MRTTLDIDAELLGEAMAAAGAPTKTAAVRLGLQALIEDAARKRLAALRGRIPDIVAPPRRRPRPLGRSR